MASFAWVLDEGKFLSEEEIQKLKALVIEKKNLAMEKGTKTAVRDWFVIQLGLYTGLRVHEMSLLKINDLKIDGERSSLFVRRGKCNKSRNVKFSKHFKKILLEYRDWKERIGEPSCPDDPLIFSSNSKGHMTTRALQKIFERSANSAGITGHSIHHLRHTYASYLLKASNFNVVLVKEQLGHSSIKVTEVYLHVLRPDLQIALDSLYSDLTTPK